MFIKSFWSNYIRKFSKEVNIVSLHPISRYLTSKHEGGLEYIYELQNSFEHKHKMTFFMAISLATHVID